MNYCINLESSLHIPHVLLYLTQRRRERGVLEDI